MDQIRDEPGRFVTHQPSGKFHGSEIPRECPFDPCHVVAAYRYQRHILRCQKQNPEKAVESRQCKFNAMHFVHKNKILEHEEGCVDKARGERRPTDSFQRTKSVTDNITVQLDENWESRSYQGQVDGTIRPRREDVSKLKEVLREKYPKIEGDFERK